MERWMKRNVDYMTFRDIYKALTEDCYAIGNGFDDDRLEVMKNKINICFDLIEDIVYAEKVSIGRGTTIVEMRKKANENLCELRDFLIALKPLNDGEKE